MIGRNYNSARPSKDTCGLGEPKKGERVIQGPRTNTKKIFTEPITRRALCFRARGEKYESTAPQFTADERA